MGESSSKERLLWPPGLGRGGGGSSRDPETIKAGISKWGSFKILSDGFESLNFYAFFLKVKLIR